MKVLTFVVVIIVSATFAVKCAEKSILNKDVGFEVTFSDGWTVTEPPMGAAANKLSIIFAEAPKVGDRPSARVNITVMLLDADATLAGQFDLYQAAEKKIVTRRELVEKKETKVSGVDAYKLTYSTDDQIGIIWIEYLIISGRRHCLIQFMVEKDEVNKVTKDVDAIVKSFKLSDPK